MTNEQTIKHLDSVIACLGADLSSEQFYAMVLGIALFRLRQILGPSQARELLEQQLQMWDQIPQTRLQGLN